MKNGYKLGLAAIVASLVLVGCGSSGSSEGSDTSPVDPMTESSVISIMYHVEEGYCSEELQNQLIVK